MQFQVVFHLYYSKRKTVIKVRVNQLTIINVKSTYYIINNC